MIRSSLLSLCFCLALFVIGCQSNSAGPAPAQPTTGAKSLSFDVFTADAKGFFATSTLIMGDTDAVLIDAQFNLANGRRLAEWIAHKGKQLKAIFVTHAHPDHYFAVEAVLARFPGTPVYATAQVVEHMRALGPKKLAYWQPIYKDDLTTRPIVAGVLTRGYLELESHKLLVINVAQGDASPTSVVHAPTIGLVVAGDLTYDGVHPWLADAATTAKRNGWLAGLDRLVALAPTHVIAGHRAGQSSGPTESIARTRRYIIDFQQQREKAADAASLGAAMTKRYPTLALPVILDLATKAAYSR